MRTGRLQTNVVLKNPPTEGCTASFFRIGPLGVAEFILFMYSEYSGPQIDERDLLFYLSLYTKNLEHAWQKHVKTSSDHQTEGRLHFFINRLHDVSCLKRTKVDTSDTARFSSSGRFQHQENDRGLA